MDAQQFLGRWILGILFLVAVPWSPLLAQDPQPTPAEAAPAETPAEPAAAAPAEPAAEAPAAEAKEGAAAAPAGEGVTESPAQQKSFLRFVFDASPVLFIIIVGMSIYLISTIISGFMALRVKNIIPPPIVEQLNERLKEKQYREAFELLRNDTSLFSRALRAGIEQLSGGWDAAMDSMLTVVEDAKIRYEHSISPVAVFGQLGPMIGLFGTVVGMILAFMSISTGGQPKPSELAAEIAIALCATMEGLTLALPAIWFYAVLKNKVHRLIFDVETLAETYLRRFSQAVKK